MLIFAGGQILKHWRAKGYPGKVAFFLYIAISGLS